jgi:hypothetical protein
MVVHTIRSDVTHAKRGFVEDYQKTKFEYPHLGRVDTREAD